MRESLEIKVGKNHTLLNLRKDLNNFGYEAVFDLSELKSGKYYYLGDTVQIHPVDSKSKIVVSFFGDTIESIKDSSQKFLKFDLAVNGFRLDDGAIIRPSDYIVHEDHGIGIFSHIEIKNVENEEISYIVITYLNDDRLYVPFVDKEKLTPYIGAGRRKPKLSKLGSITWAKNKKKVFENALKFAREMLTLYAKRSLIKRKPRLPIKSFEDEIVKSFLFQETPDQLRTMSEVYADLAKDVPMDRLICGDVGFGKTEIAIRTAACLIGNGYQVAMVVPTTILAEQHFATFKERFKNLPVRVERINRFLTFSEIEKIKQDLKFGQIDLIISTHSIFSETYNFKNLGMLIIDEEQKFGVKDKEEIKKRHGDIDVLTLSATPIPRTLFMSLSGVRDISVINNPPAGRLSVITKVINRDDPEVDRAIESELSRQGQVYYLHNEVRTINNRAKKLAKKYPNAKISVAHGQLSEKELAKVMKDFVEYKIDILVCSTIIESGIDLPNVNTLIVDEADRFGLSQLYQLRGRVGRSTVQAQALFLHGNKLTMNATKRLKALVDSSELGSGYNIALSDLEIRGGGNIIGKEQHGNMESIGLVLYAKLLKLAVARING